MYKMEQKQPGTMQEYAANRARLVENIRTGLNEDPRLLAAWLTGSFGRHDEDQMSDLDLTIVVEDAFVADLCTRPHQVWASTNHERYALFSQFGEPHIIHENNNNAPAGGTFTCVIYKDTALVVDWVLRPNASLTRPALSLLLFDKANIPVHPLASVEDVSQRAERASEQIAFFWMMVTVAIKYLIRRDDVFFHQILDMLHEIAWKVRRWVGGEPDRWHKGSYAKMAPTHNSQLAAVRRVCQDMLDLMPEVVKMGGTVPEEPMSTIETLLRFAEKDGENDEQT